MMEKMKFEINPVKNGIFVKVSGIEKEIIVHQVRFEESEEVEAFAEFLHSLMEEYGPTTSRYSPKRIYIEVRPGDKFESETE